NSTTPSANQSGWTDITSATSYSANPMFTLSSGDGTKTVYVWYKDLAGNVSTTYSDSIALAKNDSWKNWYGIAWRGTPSDSVKYAKQMGYDYIAIHQNRLPGAYSSLADRAGLKYFLIDPHFDFPTVLMGRNRYVSTTGSYTQNDINWYNQNMAWKSNDTFPNNLASGWFPSGNPNNFSIVWDFQQQAVIDSIVERIITLFHKYESTSPSFGFAGYIMDVGNITGDILRWDYTKNKPVPATLAYWTGLNSSLIHSGITHEYATYSDGLVAFYKKLNSRMKQDFHNAKWIIQPAIPYDDTNTLSYIHQDEFLYGIKDRSDKHELTPDMLTQEAGGTYYGTYFV
ncbi:MAG: hypothetical protein AAB874_04830, partial [Patescibacteria group bacterium]